MLKQATVEDIANNRVTRRHGKIIVTTRYYPRFLKKKLIDDYLSILAPTKELLSEFKIREDELQNHDLAFEDVRYEEKFTLDAGAKEVIKTLADEARDSDVYLICHCRIGQYCHREILMLLARDLFQAPVARIYHPYSTLTERLNEAQSTTYKSLWR